MSRRTAPAAYDLISIPWLRLTLGADDPLRDVAWIDPGARRVVEVGAGGGFYTGHLAAHLAEDAELTAVDPDPGAVRDLAAHARGRFDAVCATGEALPFADHSVDALLYGYCLEQFDDPDAGLAEAVRVLAPGGALVVFLWRVNLRGTHRALRALRATSLRAVRAQRGVQNVRLAMRLAAQGSSTSSPARYSWYAERSSRP